MAEEMEKVPEFQSGGLYGVGKDNKGFKDAVGAQQSVGDRSWNIAEAVRRQWDYIQYLPEGDQDWLKVFVDTTVLGFLKKYFEYVLFIIIAYAGFRLVDKVIAFFRLTSSDGFCEALLIVLFPSNAEATRRKDAAQTSHEHGQGNVNIYMPAAI